MGLFLPMSAFTPKEKPSYFVFASFRTSSLDLFVASERWVSFERSANSSRRLARRDMVWEISLRWVFSSMTSELTDSISFLTSSILASSAAFSCPIVCFSVPSLLSLASFDESVVDAFASWFLSLASFDAMSITLAFEVDIAVSLSEISFEISFRRFSLSFRRPARSASSVSSTVTFSLRLATSFFWETIVASPFSISFPSSMRLIFNSSTLSLFKDILSFDFDTLESFSIMVERKSSLLLSTSLRFAPSSVNSPDIFSNSVLSSDSSLLSSSKFVLELASLCFNISSSMRVNFSSSCFSSSYLSL